MSSSRLLPLAALTAALLLAGGCASTQRVMLAPARAAIPDSQVRVYQVPPKRYEEIARLDTTSAIGFGTQGQSDAAINRLAREAAKLGANGVILLGIDSVTPPVGVGVGTGSYGRHGGVSIGGNIPTAQRHAAGIAIVVIED